MGRNIEVKARVRDVERMRRRIVEIAGDEVEVLEQTDTFFGVASGRLKLRELAGDRGELIHYQRRDDAGAKLSSYARVATTEPAGLREMLSEALGVRGVVRKRREVFLVGQTRIHLDDVEGLGWFVELEVVLEPAQSLDDGRSIATDLQRALDIGAEDLIDRAYVDLQRT